MLSFKGLSVQLLYLQTLDFTTLDLCRSINKILDGDKYDVNTTEMQHSFYDIITINEPYMLFPKRILVVPIRGFSVVISMHLLLM